MTSKKRLEQLIRGWLPKEPTLSSNKTKIAEAKTKAPKPRWWNPLWIAILLLTIASGFITYFLLNVPLERTVSVVALTFFCIGIAYYIRFKPSIRVNRALYILLGITPLGFCLSVAYAVLLGGYVTGWLMGWFNIIVTIGILIVGAFIGDWIGKRRNYQLPLSL